MSDYTAQATPLKIEEVLKALLVKLGYANLKVYYLESDEASSRKKNQLNSTSDAYNKPTILTLKNNFNGHPINILIVGNTLGLLFQISTDTDEIFVHVECEKLNAYDEAT